MLQRLGLPYIAGFDSNVSGRPEVIEIHSEDDDCDSSSVGRNTHAANVLAPLCDDSLDTGDTFDSTCRSHPPLKRSLSLKTTGSSVISTLSFQSLEKENQNPNQLFALDGANQNRVVSQGQWDCHRLRNLSAKQLADLSEDDYKQMPFGRLSVIAGQCSRELKKALEKSRNVTARAKQAKRKFKSIEGSMSKRVKTLETCVGELRDVSTLELTTSGKSGKRLTKAGTIALGLRRNLSNIAAGDFGAVVLRDISANTVIRSEIKCAAAILTDMSLFTHNVSVSHLEQFLASGIPRELVSRATEPPWALMFVCIRSDATNSSIWRREKLNLLEAEVAIVNTPFPNLDNYKADDTSWLSRKRCLSLDFPYDEKIKYIPGIFYCFNFLTNTVSCDMQYFAKRKNTEKLNV